MGGAAVRGDDRPVRAAAAPFTLTQLRQLHQAIEGRPWQKDVFRRRVYGSLQDVGARTVVTTGRPAALLQRKVELARTVRPGAGDERPPADAGDGLPTSLSMIAFTSAGRGPGRCVPRPPRRSKPRRPVRRARRRPVDRSCRGSVRSRTTTATTGRICPPRHPLTVQAALAQGASQSASDIVGQERSRSARSRPCRGTSPARRHRPGDPQPRVAQVAHGVAVDR